MKITKRQLRRIIREACGLDTAADDHVVHSVDAPADHYSSEVPSPQDYDRVRDFLNQNSDIVDLGIGLVMDMAGTGCERSTAQGIIDHLKDKVAGHTQVSGHTQAMPHRGAMMIDLEPI